MTYGPFSTENLTVTGEARFKMYLNTESGFDYLWVLFGLGGSTQYGYKISGNSGGWLDVTVDLTDVDGLGHSVIGYPKVWLRFLFTSDYLGHPGDGAYIDDLQIRLCRAAMCFPIDGPQLSVPMRTGDYLIEPANELMLP